jgi:hypothetical protein
MGEAVLLIRPLAHPLSQAALTNSQATKDSRNKVQNVQLSSFTVRHLPPQTTPVSTVDSIVLENVVQSSLKNLQLEKGLGQSLVLRKTKDVKVEYVGMDDKSDRILGEKDDPLVIDSEGILETDSKMGLDVV